jgi:hypothetical protein
MDKKDTFNRVVMLSIISIVAASLFNLSCLPALSISIGIVAGLIASFAWLKVDSWKEFFIDLIPILLGSQIGWAALLI